MEEKNPLKDYVWNTDNTFDIMRLLVEGAVTLYDDEASPLFRLGRLNGQAKAALAFEAIGTALFELRMHIMNLQEMHGKEVEQQCRTAEVQKEYPYALLASSTGIGKATRLL